MVDKMNDVLRELSANKTKAKAKAKGLTVKQLDRLMLALSEVKEETELLEIEKQQRQEAKAEQAKKLLELMVETGVEIDDLVSIQSSTPKKPKAVVPPKYRTTIDGVVVEWTGRGRMPTALKNHLEVTGVDIESLKI